MTARIAAAVASALAVTVVAATASNAYVADGKPWPHGIIPIANAAPQYAGALYRAVRAWNLSGARVRFAYVPRSRAGIVVTTHGPSCKDASGCAYVGYFGSRDDVWIDPHLDEFSAAQVIVHELGHVLGLEHTPLPCAAMSADWTCPDPPAGKWRCRLLERDDVEGAVHLYGGTVRPLGPVNCTIPVRRYSGKTSQHRPLRVSLTTSGLTIMDMHVAVTANCGSGTTASGVEIDEDVTYVPVNPSGAFAYAERDGATYLAISGRIGPSGASGTLSYDDKLRQSGQKLTCTSGKVSWHVIPVS
jgi:Matrixin